jgi:hypothetical protein
MTTYCILNPDLNNKIEEEIYLGLSNCGINIMMDNSNIYKDPNIIILLKGEIYNIHMLCSQMNISLETKPECVIIHLYKKYGIDYTMQLLDGVFSFILFDYYFENEISKIYIVSDICGIIPLYSFIDNKTIYFTEKKIMSENKILPGCYSLYELSNTVSAQWNVTNIVNKPYFLLPNTINSINVNYDFEDYEIISNKLWKCLKQIVLKIIDVYHQNQDIVNDIVDELFSCMGIEDDKHNEIVISNERLQKQIIFSSKHFLIFNKNDTQNVFENDIMMRNKIYSTVFELDKKYPFFDKSFIMLYFSIPLSIRYHLQDDIFLLYKSRF